MHLSTGKVLVTGGAGFIGSALVWELNRRGLDNIVIADFLDESKWRNLNGLRFEDYVEANDLPGRLTADDRTYSAVFHLGACSSTTETDAAYLIRNNYEYTKSLARWALSRSVRFVYASSAAVYGGLETNLSEDRPLHSLRPLNLYGYSKHLFDCHAAANGWLDRIVGLRYFNVYGPNEAHKGEMRSMVHKAFEQIQTTGQVQLFKSYRPGVPDGCQRRDFVYVKDAVRATIHLAENDAANGLFNVGSGEPSSWLALVSAVFSALGRECQIEMIAMPESIRRHYQYVTCAVLDRLRATGFADRMTPLAEGVRDYVQCYLLAGRGLAEGFPQDGQFGR